MSEVGADVQKSADFARVRLRGAWIALVSCVLLAGLAAWLVLHNLGFAIESSLEFSGVLPGSSAVDRDLAWSQLLGTESVILRSQSTCAQAVAELGARQLGLADHEGVLDAAAQICQALRVRRVPGTSVLRVQYDDGDSARGMRIVDAVVQAYVERTRVKQGAQPTAIKLPQAEIELRAEDVTQAELALHNFAKEHDLLTYDRQAATASLQPLRQELTQKHVQTLELQAQQMQLEAAIQAKTYQVPLLADDVEMQAIRLRILAFKSERALAATQTADAGTSAGVDATMARLQAELEAVALNKLAMVRAEAALVRDAQRRLDALLHEEQEALARHELDAIELRRRQRALAAQQALYESALRAGGPAALSAWTVSPLDGGHIVGRSAPAWAWPLGLASLLGVGLTGWWLWRGRALGARRTRLSAIQ